MKKSISLTTLALGLALSLGATLSFAQNQAAPAANAAPAVWKYKTKHLNKDDVDQLLSQPDKIVVLDVRRPDELIKYGSFPVYLNIQNKDVEKHLAYLPKDRAIITVSNHAQRAGATGDLLSSKGFNVVGATGSEDYEQEGGKAVVKITPPPPRVAANAAATAAAPVAAVAAVASPK
ncbi:rhodanese-like domain-containing protein [Paucibacter sp. TC2R-5]|uniref:rhodanese-like domain-containing protein n=1 Tax=Paucibacter sp. TC2R-5 TaxID=2893555 RepID=UPI0021E3B096|nr:rhodanese-like domain-containing protein [Paucibacter sp. TC2R-5]MCV2361248.1 rhodanese-like domain-containing protein [Paucibacter sp. TC2R-5]